MRRVFIFLIQAYQKIVPTWLRGSCKYFPTCSQYAIEAYRRYGSIGGTLLTAGRILRCNPFSKGGVDFVPDKFLFFTGRE